MYLDIFDHHHKLTFVYRLTFVRDVREWPEWCDAVQNQMRDAKTENGEMCAIGQAKEPVLVEQWHFQLL